MGPGDDRRVMVYSAAGIYAGAVLLGLLEAAIPGGETLSLIPDLVALAVGAVIVVFGRRVPRRVLAAAGLLGAALIGVALATTGGYGDGAVLYMWPVLWMAYFFGDRGTAVMVVWVGIVHALVQAALPPMQASIDRWLDVEGAVIVVAVVVRMLAARNERLTAKLSAEARVDPLTGVANRRGFEERMDVEITRAARDRSWLAVAVFDLDHFKRVNDVHGHEIGDRVLVWLGTILREQARGGDIVARVGGEEFVAVLPRADVAGAQAFAERVRKAVATSGVASDRGRFGIGESLQLSVSAGVTAEIAPGDAPGLLERADHAMYAAKRDGRNRVSAAYRTADPGARGAYRGGKDPGLSHVPVEVRR